MDKNKKNAIVLSIVAVVTLIALVVGATYAYFKAQGGTSSSTEVKVTTYTTDMLTFTTGKAIGLYADQSSFGQEKGSLSGETFAKATLVANNKTNEATDNYYVYFNIENNTFKYTLGEDKPELILTVTGPDGSEVTELPGLTHTTVQDRENKSISGFDVTTTNRLITIANKKTITASPNAEEEYKLKLTFVNYEGDQTANASSGLSAKVMIQKEKIVQTVANICKGGQSLSSCLVAMDGIDETLYHHDANLTNGAGDNSYRFAGASDAVNNYVCFGSTQSPCPDDNKYRIIGVFDTQVGENQTEQRVKLIKSTSAGDKAWDTGNKNTWSTSSLNTYLNNEFINAFDETTKGNIADTTWKVGGNTFADIAKQPAKTAYQNEVVNPVPGSTSSNGETESSAKVGLMYASDYGFAAAPSAWTSTLYDYDGAAIKNVNWMYMGLNEWTISRRADDSDGAFIVESVGDVYNSSVDDHNGVRPSFNLTSSVNYVSGSGSATDPIVVN